MKEIGYTLNMATRTVAFHRYRLWMSSARRVMPN
ncbi:MAG TPA: hypothetical protein VHL05_16150 [Terriglobales bacterium]|nr:hypothetical protein [Terriglobales bacterium]